MLHIYIGFIYYIQTVYTREREIIREKKKLSTILFFKANCGGLVLLQAVAVAALTTVSQLLDASVPDSEAETSGKR